MTVTISDDGRSQSVVIKQSEIFRGPHAMNCYQRLKYREMQLSSEKVSRVTVFLIKLANSFVFCHFLIKPWQPLTGIGPDAGVQTGEIGALNSYISDKKNSS